MVVEAAMTGRIGDMTTDVMVATRMVEDSFEIVLSVSSHSEESMGRKALSSTVDQVPTLPREMKEAYVLSRMYY